MALVCLPLSVKADPNITWLADTVGFCHGQFTCASSQAVESVGSVIAADYIFAQEESPNNQWDPNDDVILDKIRVVIRQCPSLIPHFGETIYTYDYTVNLIQEQGGVILTVGFQPVTLVSQVNNENCGA